MSANQKTREYLEKLVETAQNVGLNVFVIYNEDMTSIEALVIGKETIMAKLSSELDFSDLVNNSSSDLKQ